MERTDQKFYSMVIVLNNEYAYTNIPRDAVDAETVQWLEEQAGNARNPNLNSEVRAFNVLRKENNLYQKATFQRIDMVSMKLVRETSAIYPPARKLPWRIPPHFLEDFIGTTKEDY